MITKTVRRLLTCTALLGSGAVGCVSGSGSSGGPLDAAASADASVSATCGLPSPGGDCSSPPGTGEALCCPYLATHYDLVANCGEPAGRNHRTYGCFMVHVNYCASTNGPYCFVMSTQDGGVDLTQVYYFDTAYPGLEELGLIRCPASIPTTPLLVDGGGLCTAPTP